jgi:hypothetical protein
VEVFLSEGLVFWRWDLYFGRGRVCVSVEYTFGFDSLAIEDVGFGDGGDVSFSDSLIGVFIFFVCE